MRIPAALARLLGVTEAVVFRALMGLPPAVVRKLAGRPVVADGQRLDPEMQWMLRLQKIIREPPVESLPLPAARRAFGRQTRLVGGSKPIGEVRELVVPGAEHDIPARLYIPRGQLGSEASRGAGSPLLVFAHGGGMMYGDLDSHDPLCRFLAEQARVIVLSVDYRLAPEHRFPSAIEDCWASYRWVVRNAATLGADPERLAVGGDSAGGYMSAVTAIRAAEAGLPLRHQLLVYPVTDMSGRSRSRARFGEGFYLTTAFMDLAESAYLRSDADRTDPRASVLMTAQIPEGLAPAHVVTAGFDPLRDEGEAYAQLLTDAGVPVEVTRYPGLIHGFVNIVGVGRSSRGATVDIAARLRAALS